VANLNFHYPATTGDSMALIDVVEARRGHLMHYQTGRTKQPPRLDRDRLGAVACGGFEEPELQPHSGTPVAP
jgi:hypothetical protein